MYPDADKQKAKEAKDFKAMRAEVLEMQQICETLQSPVVFNHNDLLSGNVMIPIQVRGLSHHANIMMACALLQQDFAVQLHLHKTRTAIYWTSVHTKADQHATCAAL